MEQIVARTSRKVHIAQPRETEVFAKWTSTGRFSIIEFPHTKKIGRRTSSRVRDERYDLKRISDVIQRGPKRCMKEVDDSNPIARWAVDINGGYREVQSVIRTTCGSVLDVIHVDSVSLLHERCQVFYPGQHRSRHDRAFQKSLIDLGTRLTRSRPTQQHGHDGATDGI